LVNSPQNKAPPHQLDYLFLTRTLVMSRNVQRLFDARPATFLLCRLLASTQKHLQTFLLLFDRKARLKIWLRSPNIHAKQELQNLTLITVMKSPPSQCAGEIAGTPKPLSCKIAAFKRLSFLFAGSVTLREYCIVLFKRVYRMMTPLPSLISKETLSCPTAKPAISLSRIHRDSPRSFPL